MSPSPESRPPEPSPPLRPGAARPRAARPGSARPGSGSVTTAATVTDVAWFFTIAVLLCFTFSIPLVLHLVSPDLNNLIVPLLQLTPLLAALVMWQVRRPGTFRETFATSWRGAARWCGAGVGIIAAIAAVQTAIAVATGIWALNPLDQILLATPWILPVFVMQSVFAIGEEFGWRGWLATRAASWGFWPLAVVSGLVWIIWHLPVLAVIGDLSPLGILVYFAGMLPWAPLLLALRMRSGSVWPAVLAHGAINSVRVYLLQSVPAATDHLLIEVIGWVLTVGVAVWLMRPGVSRELPGQPGGGRELPARPGVRR